MTCHPILLRIWFILSVQDPLSNCASMIKSYEKKTYPGKFWVVSNISVTISSIPMSINPEDVLQKIENKARLGTRKPKYCTPILKSNWINLCRWSENIFPGWSQLYNETMSQSILWEMGENVELHFSHGLYMTQRVQMFVSILTESRLTIKWEKL